MKYQVTDRRPIAARNLGVMAKIAKRLAAAGVTPNAVSLFGGACATIAGASLVATNVSNSPTLDRLLWLVVALGCQGRLLCNLFDGMVAVERNTASAVGELYNEVPDRYSDAVIFVALGYAAGGVAWLGWAAAVAAILTAYVRAVGKAAGLKNDFRGPMAKQQRMFLVTLLGVAGLILPRFVAGYHAAAWVAAIVAVGSLLTCINRLRHIARGLRAGA